jgi:hypothetical protein
MRVHDFCHWTVVIDNYFCSQIVIIIRTLLIELSCRRIVNEWCRLNATINPPAGVLYMLIWYIFFVIFFLRLSC